jgi:CubicO group peptidase (beta-lactamase class C family)
VHDENAAAAGGGTGHAGLFSTADDMATFAAELLRARKGESRIFPAALIARFTAPAGIVPGSSRALGWDTPSGLSSAGSLLSRSSFGHTGFTGTSIWIDPERDIYIVLLSNRVHPTRENTKIAVVRRALAEAVALAVDASSAGPRPSVRKRTRI